MTNYYAAGVDSDGCLRGGIYGPYATHTEAMKYHADKLMRGVVREPGQRPAVLLDLDSIGPQLNTLDSGLTLKELQELLHHDPVLHAIFTLGRNVGAREESDRAHGRA